MKSRDEKNVVVFCQSQENAMNQSKLATEGGRNGRAVWVFLLIGRGKHALVFDWLAHVTRDFSVAG